MHLRSARTGRSKDRGFDAGQLDGRLAEECADVLGHVLLFARRNRIDLDATWFQWERLA